MKIKKVIDYIEQEIDILKNRLQYAEYEEKVGYKRITETEEVVKRIKNKIKILDASIKILECKK